MGQGKDLQKLAGLTEAEVEAAATAALRPLLLSVHDKATSFMAEKYTSRSEIDGTFYPFVQIPLKDPEPARIYSPKDDPARQDEIDNQLLLQISGLDLPVPLGPVRSGFEKLLAQYSEGSPYLRRYKRHDRNGVGPVVVTILRKPAKSMRDGRFRFFEQRIVRRESGLRAVDLTLGGIVLLPPL